MTIQQREQIASPATRNDDHNTVYKNSGQDESFYKHVSRCPLLCVPLNKSWRKNEVIEAIFCFLLGVRNEKEIASPDSHRDRNDDDKHDNIDSEHDESFYKHVFRCPLLNTPPAIVMARESVSRRRPKPSGLAYTKPMLPRDCIAWYYAG